VSRIISYCSYYVYGVPGSKDNDDDDDDNNNNNRQGTLICACTKISKQKA
jgi:hypothetical protein